MNLAGIATEISPIGDLAREDGLHLLGAELGHGIVGMNDRSDTVDSEGERDQIRVELDLFVLERTTGVADLHEPLAHLLDADSRTATGDRDEDGVIGRHDVRSGGLHDRDVCRAARDVEVALEFRERIKRRGFGCGIYRRSLLSGGILIGGRTPRNTQKSYSEEECHKERQ